MPDTSITRPPWPDMIRAARDHLGLTQVEFARRLGVSTRAVQTWEAGEREPAAYLLIALEHMGYTPEAVA